MTARLFDVGAPTPTERAGRSGAARGAQLSMVIVDEPRPAYCHVCTGAHEAAECTVGVALPLDLSRYTTPKGTP